MKQTKFFPMPRKDSSTISSAMLHSIQATVKVRVPEPGPARGLKGLRAVRLFRDAGF